MTQPLNIIESIQDFNKAPFHIIQTEEATGLFRVGPSAQPIQVSTLEYTPSGLALMQPYSSWFASYLFDFENLANPLFCKEGCLMVTLTDEQFDQLQKDGWRHQAPGYQAKFVKSMGQWVVTRKGTLSEYLSFQVIHDTLENLPPHLIKTSRDFSLIRLTEFQAVWHETELLNFVTKVVIPALHDSPDEHLKATAQFIWRLLMGLPIEWMINA